LEELVVENVEEQRLVVVGRRQREAATKAIFRFVVEHRDTLEPPRRRRDGARGGRIAGHDYARGATRKDDDLVA
jgi:hypothetical protein